MPSASALARHGEWIHTTNIYKGSAEMRFKKERREKAHLNRHEYRRIKYGIEDRPERPRKPYRRGEEIEWQAFELFDFKDDP